jgi:hypothetical protein
MRVTWRESLGGKGVLQVIALQHMTPDLCLLLVGLVGECCVGVVGS